MKAFKLIYFKGCPNHPPAVELLDSLGIDYESINQDDLEEKSPLKNYSSPTLLKNDKIIFGSMATGGGCSVQLPSLSELEKLLKN